MNEFYGSKHWSARYKIANLYHQSVVLQSRNKGKIESYPIKAFYRFFFKGRLPDVSNAPVKLIEDGLVMAGVLQGDSPKYVREISVSVEKGKEDFVEVEII